MCFWSTLDSFYWSFKRLQDWPWNQYNTVILSHFCCFVCLFSFRRVFGLWRVRPRLHFPLPWRWRRHKAGLGPGRHGDAIRQRVFALSQLRPWPGRWEVTPEERPSPHPWTDWIFLGLDDLRRLGVASHKPFGSGSPPDQSGLSALEKEDVVDSKGTRWRCFSTGDPPQESRVNMTVLEPFLRVLSHGGTAIEWVSAF